MKYLEQFPEYVELRGREKVLEEKHKMMIMKMYNKRKAKRLKRCWNMPIKKFAII